MLYTAKTEGRNRIAPFSGMHNVDLIDLKDQKDTAPVGRTCLFGLYSNNMRACMLKTRLSDANFRLVRNELTILEIHTKPPV
ncbi:hypothetical protein D1872_274840 [compost metagenome]